MTSDVTWYEILDISIDATAEEIKQAYFAKAKQYHPDTNPSKIAKDWFFQVQQAYEILSDPNKRENYDGSIKNHKKNIENFEISILPSSVIIPRLKEPQLFYAILTVSCTSSVEKKDTPHGNFCLIVDCSTSMNGMRIEMIKSNIIRLVSSLKPNDVISIIAFNDSAEIFLAPTQIKNIHQIDEKLAQLKCAGGTEIFKGIKAGFDLLWGNTTSDTVNQMLLLTDGHTYGDEEKCYELAQKCRSRGIVINALGIGNEWNDIFLDHLTSLTGGKACFISTVEELDNYIQELGDFLAILAAEAVSLDFQSDSGIVLNSIYRTLPDMNELPLEKPIPMGEIYYKKPSSFLLTFKIPPARDDQTSMIVAKGKIILDALSSVKVKQKLGFNLDIPIMGESQNDDPPKSILAALSAITIYQMQEKANSEVKNGNLEKAIDRLGNISTQLLKMGKYELAEKTQQEAQMLKVNKKYSIDGDKQLKYGTRALLSYDKEERLS